MWNNTSSCSNSSTKVYTVSAILNLVFYKRSHGRKIYKSVYANYFYDTLVILSYSIITYLESFTICIGHERRTDVIGID